MRVLAAIAALLGALAASPAALAQDCRLALLLALDVSASVDEAEHRLQREGLAAALLSPEVLDPLLNGPGPVALAVYSGATPRVTSVTRPQTGVMQ